MPSDRFLDASILLRSETSRCAGLRMVATDAIDQSAAALALDATEELLRRGERSNGDILLRAAALKTAGRLAEALETCLQAGTGSEVKSLVSILQLLLGHPRAARASALAAMEDGVNQDSLRRLRWLAAYAGAAIGEPSGAHFSARWRASRPEGDVPIIALLDFKSPDFDKNSIDIEDWIESLAAMRHLARLDGVHWSFDDPDLEPLFLKLKSTWAPEDLVACAGRAHLAIVDRDFSQSVSFRFPGRPVWVIGSASYGEEVFGDSRAWPAPVEYEPILLATSIKRAGDLTADRLAWLRENGPVGCRDLATEAWLLNQGVEAYFSGAMAMTLAPGAPSHLGERLAVDAPPVDDEWRRAYTKDPTLKTSSFTASINRAADLVERLAGASEVHTSRTIVALAAKAVQTKTDFAPRDPSDRAHFGLRDLDPETFSRTAHRLTELMAEILTLIVKRGPCEAIRSRIRTFSKPVQSSQPIRWSALAAATRPEKSNEVTVAIAFDENYISYARTLLWSIRRNSKARICAVLLVRNLTSEVARQTVEIVEPFDVRVFDMREGLAGTTINLVPQTTMSTMDRLFLPDMLPDLDNIVYIDCDTLVLGDIAELASYDTGETGVAARKMPGPIPCNVAHAIERLARPLDQRRADELRLWSAANVDLAAPFFNAGVLKLSLATLRKSRIALEALEIVEKYAVNDQDALNLATRGRAYPLPEDWNTITHIDLGSSPKLIHWAGVHKPWLSETAQYAKDWKSYSKAAESRAKFMASPERATNDQYSSRRCELAAAWLPDDGRIADVGCGPQMVLRRLIDPRIAYVPADIRGWSPEVVVIDLDRVEFPPGRFDAVAMLGVLEFLQRPGAALRRARRASDTLIASYSHPRKGASKQSREERGWISSLTENALSTLFARQGWAVQEVAEVFEVELSRELLYRCTARDVEVVPRGQPDQPMD